MEAAPLTLAHTHARNAVLETRKSNPVAASEEHDLAAGEFAAAAHNTVDQEALRTLQLLEQHHKKLAEILRFQHENPAQTSEVQNAAVSSAQGTQPSTGVGHTKTSIPSNQDAQGQPLRLSGKPRMPSRESSSIASNLASARGIPSQPRRGSPVSPTLSAHQAGAKMTEGPSRVTTGESRLRDVPNKYHSTRASASRQPWSPPLPSPTEITSKQVVPSEFDDASHARSKLPATDEPFQRFYSTFEGLISKISAPLAFAGLPLGSGDPGQSSSSTRKSSAETKLDYHHATSNKGSSLAEPDVNRLFSQAALRSIRESPGTNIGNPAESFYVVPTTGGTMSYAGILTRAEKEARRRSLDEGEDDFVDARETPSSPEMRQSAGSSNTRSTRQGAPEKFTTIQNPKTIEELQIENDTLKQLSDTLSRRLHMWEVNAQSSSMALQQSLRAIHHQSPETLPHEPSAGSSPIAQMSTAHPMPDSDATVKELKALLRRSEQEQERIKIENDKLNNVLGRYRDRWEKLKEGAKTRRAEGRSNGGQSNPPTPVPNSRAPNTPLSPQPDSDSNGASDTQGTTSREAEGK